MATFPPPQNPQNQKFFELMDKMGDPLENPSAYFKTLNDTLADDERNDFIAWRASFTRPSIARKITPQIFVDRLHEFDPRLPASMATFASTTAIGFLGGVPELPLAKDAAVEYFVRPSVGAISTRRVTDEAETSSSTPANFDPLSMHGYILSLSSQALPATGQKPAYVFPIGPLLYRKPGTALNGPGGKAPEPVDTNYVVVVDVGSPQKGIWILYNYEPRNELGDRARVELPSDGLPDGILGSRNGEKFDAAMLAAAAEWEVSGITGGVQLLERNIQRSCGVFNLVASPVREDEVKKALESGWKGLPSKSGDPAAAAA